MTSDTLEEVGTKTFEPAARAGRSRLTLPRIRTLLGYLLLTFSVIIIVGPFVVALLNTFKTNAEFIRSTSILPEEFTLENYVRIFTEIPMMRMIFNGLFIAILATAGSLVASLVGAFCLAKLKFFGRGTLFRSVLFTMLVPATITLIPLYVLVRSVGLVNTPWALILPFWFGTAFAVFFLRQHLMVIPHEMFEAAILDGCSIPRMIFQIYLPLVRGPLAILAILGFIYSWNDLLGPLIYLNSPEKMTPTVGLTFYQGQYTTDFPMILTGSVIILIPTTIIFLVFNRYIRDGLALGGVLK